MVQSHSLNALIPTFSRTLNEPATTNHHWENSEVAITPEWSRELKIILCAAKELQNTVKIFVTERRIFKCAEIS